MHYVANTMYHARECDTEGKQPGDVIRHEVRLGFKGCAFTFSEHEKGFWEYLDGVGDFEGIEVEAVKYDGTDSYAFSDNYSLTGFIKENDVKKWYLAPFKSRREATEFLRTVQTSAYKYIHTPSAWAKAVEPNLEHARSSAVWPEATLEQLQNKDLLVARLPAMLAEFKSAVESFGFTY